MTFPTEGSLLQKTREFFGARFFVHLEINDYWNMKARVFYLSLLMFWTLSPVNTFDPITAALLVGAGATLGPLAWVTWGHFHESCDSRWIHFNEPGENVWGGYGMHLQLQQFAFIIKSESDAQFRKCLTFFSYIIFSSYFVLIGTNNPVAWWSVCTILNLIGIS